MLSYLRRLSPYWKPHRKNLALALFCTIASGALMAVFYWLLYNVLGEIPGMPGNHKASHAPAITPTFNTGKFGLFLIGVFVWMVARAVVDFGREYCIQRVWQRILTRLRFDLFAHFQNLSIDFFEKRRTGELMSRMTNDLGALQSIMTDALLTSVRAPIEVAVSIGAMFFLSWKLSLIIFLILPPIAWLVNRAGTRMRKATRELQEQTAEVTHFLQEKIGAMRLVLTFGMRDHEIKTFAGLNNDAYRRSMKPIRIQTTLGPTIDFIAYLGVVSVLWVSVRNGVDFAALGTFLMAMHRAAGQLRSLASLNNTIKKGQAAADRLFELLDVKPAITDAPNAIDLRERQVEGHLVFEDVRFAYNGGPEVLHGISFEVKPGEVVALAGLSGSGKTTISSLVPRLYDPKGGRVLLDGIDLRDVQMLSLRAHIGAVPQETTLFHGTIRDNIAYGRPKASLDEVVDAARKAHADEFIRKMPEGYETQIGERGNLLSGGQRQRLAIARALLRDPRILILDEATSSLDAESERLVQDALGVLMEGRTTLIIAHRFATIWRANKILVLEEGNIAEEGTHQELLARRGIYFRLYQMQAFMERQQEEEANERQDTSGASDEYSSEESGDDDYLRLAASA
jgi:subfamily B ATP-binding cassette protein MsbA